VDAVLAAKSGLDLADQLDQVAITDGGRRAWPATGTG
jgi:hypothetical protein